jgi:hypothetical protein
MLEKVRDVKIKDYNTRQRVNLFIDKINKARDNALRAIEKEQTALVAVDEGHAALMQQRLQHLNMPLSKVTLKGWLNMIDQMEIYYPEDQKKIIQFGIKKGHNWYWESVVSRHVFRVFQENLEMKSLEVSMTGLLQKGFRNGGVAKAASCLVPGGGPLDILEYIRQFYLAADGSTPERAEEYIRDLLHENFHHSNYPYEFAVIRRDYLLSKLPAIQQILSRYSGENARLSLLLRDTVDVEQKGRYGTVAPDEIKYDLATERWKIEPASREVVKRSILDHFQSLFFDFNHVLFTSYGYKIKGAHGDTIELIDYEESSFSQRDKRKSLDCSKYLPIFKKMCDFLPNIKIDRETLNHVNSPVSKHVSVSIFENPSLFTFFRYKFSREALGKEEIGLIFKNPEFYSMFASHTSSSQSDGSFHRHEEYVEEYLETATEMFDFASEDDMMQYFGRLLYGKHRMVTPIEQITRKLSQERPHEFALLIEYFTVQEQTFEGVEIFDRFEGRSQLEMFLLSREGVAVGQKTSQSGVRIDGNILEAEEARNVFIIEYYKNLYGKREME